MLGERFYHAWNSAWAGRQWRKQPGAVIPYTIYVLYVFYVIFYVYLIFFILFYFYLFNSFFSLVVRYLLFPFFLVFFYFPSSFACILFDLPACLPLSTSSSAATRFSPFTPNHKLFVTWKKHIKATQYPLVNFFFIFSLFLSFFFPLYYLFVI